MRLYYDHTRKAFIADVPYAQRSIARNAGFTWTRVVQGKWATQDPMLAAKLIHLADHETQSILSKVVAQRQENLDLSRAANLDIELPHPDGLDYLPYQKAGVAFMQNKDGVLLGDDMGLGKTIQVIGLINVNPHWRNILIVCPASLRLNWQRELERWLVNDYTIGIADTKDGVPDSDIVIVNYDILHKLNLADWEWDLVALDEAHYIKNSKTLRSKAIKGERRNVKEKGWTWVREPIHADVKVAMTGTPIPNRVAEIYNILNWLDPGTWRNYMQFAQRYAGARQGKFGMEEGVPQHLDELQDKLRSTIMVRRRKADVLKELPPKRRVVVPLPTNGSVGIVDREMRAYQKHVARLEEIKAEAALAKAAEDKAAYAAAVTRLRELQGIMFTEMAKVRAETAIAKAPLVAEHCANILEGSDPDYKLIIFAHHKAVVQLLCEKLESYGVVSITGDTPMQERQDGVDVFQHDPNVRVFVGNIQAAGVGLTLTASSHVVFAELDWTPANVTQAEDRAHRIGQEESVLVEHLVFDGSLDAKMAKTIVRKQAIADRALDDPYELSVDVPVTVEEDEPQKIIEKNAEPLTPDQRAAVQEALEILAGMDMDGARAQNGVGFNRFDTTIGRSLAATPLLSEKQFQLGRKIVRKYVRQLPTHLVEKLKG